MGAVMKLSDRLKELRKRAGLSQTEIARKIGVPISTYNSYETKGTFPPPSRLAKIAQVLNCTIPDLMGYPDELLNDPLSAALKLIQNAGLLVEREGDNIVLKYIDANGESDNEYTITTTKAPLLDAYVATFRRVEPIYSARKRALHEEMQKNFVQNLLFYLLAKQSSPPPTKK